MDGIKVVCIAWDGEGKKATGWESRFAARSKRGAFRRLGLGTVSLDGGNQAGCARRLMSAWELVVRMTGERTLQAVIDGQSLCDSSINSLGMLGRGRLNHVLASV